jgi:hypothetical protein
MLNRLRKLLFREPVEVEENEGVSKPSIGTIVRNIETKKRGEVVPNDCHAVKVRYENSSVEYFKYSVFWMNNETIETPIDNVVSITFSK